MALLYFLTTISHNTTGVKTITCGFPPVRAKITVISNGSADPIAHKSEGVTDGTNQICDTFAVKAASGYSYSDRFNDRLVSFHEFDGSGNPTLVTRANYDSKNATQFKYNVITANVNCQYRVEIEG